MAQFKIANYGIPAYSASFFFFSHQRFIYWTQYSPTNPSLSALYQLNLRNHDVTKLISSPALGRRKRRRVVSLSSIELTAALVMDPFTDHLLVSDRASGGILSCNVTLAPIQCSIMVDPSQLTGTPAEGDIFLLLILSLPSPRPLSLSSAFSCLKVKHVHYVSLFYCFSSFFFYSPSSSSCQDSS